MKHASPAALVALQPLLESLRQVGDLVERKPGVFYRRGMAFLHFHEDPAGLFADVKLGGPTFTRWPVNTADERAELLEQVRHVLAPSGS